MTEEEKEILYFIEQHMKAISGTQYNGWKFEFPPIPHPDNGVEFCNKHKARHEKVAQYLIAKDRIVHFVGWDKPVLLK
jgi:peptidase E